MTSSENQSSFAAYDDLWMFQSTDDSTTTWSTKAFSRDAEALTRALQKIVSSDTTNNGNSESFITSSDAVSSFQHTPTASGVSGSDLETAASRRRGAIKNTGAVTKKIAKRKPRGKAKCQTTVIMADPSNFRQMVQEITGVRFETQQLQNQQQQQNQLIVKPEPKRLTGNGLPMPTLDTSSFLVQQQMQQGGVCVNSGQLEGSLTGADELFGQVAYGDSLIGGEVGYGYEPHQNFPTLESYKVMCDY